MPESTDPRPSHPDDAQTVNERLDRLRAALGFSSTWKPHPHLGESTSRVVVWSQLELGDLYERLGCPGPITVRRSEATLGNPVFELAFSTVIEGVGTVEITTDWYPAFADRATPAVQAAMAGAA
ncbi:hypothetical protein ABTZ78_17245 [Streptomyces bauhiniae]|uniref:hypothetical protein n=1 Tax=Streptomyces bauhiniae TaxID=2340725 RepID=UPI003325F4DA